MILSYIACKKKFVTTISKTSYGLSDAKHRLTCSVFKLSMVARILGLTRSKRVLVVVRTVHVQMAASISYLHVYRPCSDNRLGVSSHFVIIFLSPFRNRRALRGLFQIFMTRKWWGLLFYDVMPAGGCMVDEQMIYLRLLYSDGKSCASVQHFFCSNQLRIYKPVYPPLCCNTSLPQNKI